jgi:hypothetical protein
MKRQLFFLLFFVAAGAVFLACSKEYSYEGGTSIPVAKGTLKIDTSGECLPVVIGGTFYDGVTPFSDTNFVMVEMNVTKPGSYYIKTDVQNGFQLIDSGYFHVAGNNTAFLRVIGTPILHIPTDFTITFDTTQCTFTINVQDSTGTHLGGNGGGTTVTTSDTDWHFNVGNAYYHGSVDTTSIQTSGGFTILGIGGFTAATGDSVLALDFILPNGVITPGNYFTVGTPNSTAVFGFALISTGNSIYDAIDGASIPCSMTLTIDSYNSTTHIISGSFSGTAEDPSAGISVPITNGHYTAKVNQ